MFRTIKNSNYGNKLGFLVLLLLLIKVVLIPLVHQTNADAISRIYLSLQFSKSPAIISHGNWPPIFFYIMGGALKIYNNQFVTPILVNILFSVFLLIPLFNILKKAFSDQIAFWLCVFFSFSPIVFRMSLIGMSEIPYLFFVILSIAILIKGVETKNYRTVIIAGLILSIACGIRYESWIIGGIITVILYYWNQKRSSFLFATSFIIFPLYWLTSNYLNTQNPIDSFNWAINLSEKESIGSFESFLRRIWWYPLSLMFAFGPIAYVYFIIELKEFKSNKISRVLFSVFQLFFTIWLINALRGSLLLQHRFSITLFLIAFPFLGFYFKRNNKNIASKIILLSSTAFLLSYVYSSKGARPIPRLLTKDATTVTKLINNNLNDSSAFICDFWNWETSYFLPFSTGLPANRIAILDQRKPKKQQLKESNQLLTTCSNGVILLKKGSAFSSHFTIKEKRNSYILNPKISIVSFFENDKIICLKYSKK